MNDIIRFILVSLCAVLPIAHVEAYGVNEEAVLTGAFGSDKQLTRPENSAEVNRIFRFGPGVHELDEIVLRYPHSLVEGVGTGITVLKLKKGIKAHAPNPIIRNLSVVGEGSGTGLHLLNTWSAKVYDVEVEGFATGIKIELSEQGRKMARGKTLNHWPGPLTEGGWGSRVTLTEIKSIEITGPGDGIVLVNSLKTDSSGRKYWKPTDDKKPGEFMNATTIWGGHIGVKGRALVIGNGVFKTKLIGTYIDISPAGGIIMEDGSRGLTLVGVNLDLNSAATRAGSSRITASKRELKSIQMYGTFPDKIRIHDHNKK